MKHRSTRILRAQRALSAHTQNCGLASDFARLDGPERQGAFEDLLLDLRILASADPALSFEAAGANSLHRLNSLK